MVNPNPFYAYIYSLKLPLINKNYSNYTIKDVKEKQYPEDPLFLLILSEYLQDPASGQSQAYYLMVSLRCFATKFRSIQNNAEFKMNEIFQDVIYHTNLSMEEIANKMPDLF